MAGLTKQQEIIVGVGLLALLGYFAFKEPEKPLKTAPGHSRGDDPAFDIPKLEPVVQFQDVGKFEDVKKKSTILR